MTGSTSLPRAVRASLLATLLLAPLAAGAQGLPGFAHGRRFTVSHSAPGAQPLTDFQQRILLDTATEIAAGRMNADCSDLRVYEGSGCTPTVAVPFWVADGTCDSATTEVWLMLPRVAVGSVTALAVFWGNASATSASNGAAVFPIFFDDFNGASPTLDAARWNTFGPVLQSGGTATTTGGAAAFWSTTKVLADGATVFGIRTNAQSVSGADVEFGASTLVAPCLAPSYCVGGATSLRWSDRTYTGGTWMSWSFAAAYIGKGTSGGECAGALDVGSKWANDVGVTAYFQTEFYYETDAASGGSTFGIYDKLGAKRSYTAGGASCRIDATESAYFQFDHADVLPNPVSAVDYAYVRKYANPDPVLSTTNVDIGPNACEANGYGPCTSGEVCASATCSASGHCVPTSNGCWLDSECAAASHCDRATLTCAADLAPGAAIPSDGLHGGTCADAPAVCATGLCDAATSTCASANGAACTGASQCVSNTCASGHCVPAASGCWLDSDCAAASYCDRATLACAADLAPGAAIPSDGLHGGACADAPAVCATGLCDAATSTCASANGAACTAHDQCVSDTCTTGHCVPTSNGCWLDSECAAASHCDRATLTCAADLAPGAAIPSDGLHGGACADAPAVCATGLCDAATSTCASANGAACTAHDQCVSDTCTTGHCVPTSNGCWLDSDCAAASHCDRATLACAADLAPGAAIPSDGLHGGACADAPAVCATGLCDAATSTCASANGAACTAHDQCVSDTCTTGHCVPTSNGCWLDSDCAAASYCDRATLACAADLASGAAIPSDGLHGGTCADAPAVCATGLCNERVRACAQADGTACVNDGACASDACVAGQCGARVAFRGGGGCGQGSAGWLSALPLLATAGLRRRRRRPSAAPPAP
jgi:hypothetical protein